jgi:hypothetical protein
MNSKGMTSRPASLIGWVMMGLLVLVLLAPLPAAAGPGQWTNIGPYGGTVLAIAIDPITPSNIYAGTYNGGVYKSMNGGGSWSHSNSGLTDNWVPALAIDPLTPATIYAGAGGVYKSTNGGESWSNTGPKYHAILALAIDPAAPATIYAGTNNDGVYKNINGGTNWSWTGPTIAGINALAIDPFTPSTVYAGGGGVYKSTDNGNSWTPSNNGLFGPTCAPSVKSLVIDPVTPSTIYAGGTSCGVFKSTNGGGSWSQINTGLPNIQVNALVIDPGSPATIYAGTNGDGVYGSTNGGESWSQINAGLTDTTVHALALIPGTPATIYAGTDSGVFVMAPTFTITAAAAANGTISPAGAVTVIQGNSQTFTIIPNAGFAVAALVVDGTQLPGATSYTFTDVAADHYINAYFEPSALTITAAAAANGSISPAGAIAVTSGSNMTYTITPNAGFMVAALVVDGSVLPGAATYTFANVAASHYINAYFKPIATFEITSAAAANGNISPAGATAVTSGSNQTYTITPNTGFTVAALVVDGTVLPGTTTYTFMNVTGSHYVNAYFEAIPATVTITSAAGPNGTISPAGANTVAGGTNQTFTITPNAGFAVAALVVDGQLLPGATTYTFTNVTTSHYINAYFQ